jgi:hypothetical protein
MTTGIPKFAFSLGVVAAGAVLAFAGVSEKRDDWRGTAGYLREVLAEGDCLVFSPSYVGTPFYYYFGEHWPCAQWVDVQAGDSIGPVPSRTTYSVVWRSRDQNGVIDTSLRAQGFIPSDFRDFDHVSIKKYTRAESTSGSPRLIEALPIRVELWGQSYVEDATFELRADGNVIVSGTISAAQPNPPQSFEGMLEVDAQSLEIALTNDRFEGATKDINVVVGKMFVAGRPIDLSQIDLGDTPYLARKDDGTILVSTEALPLVVTRPLNGWSSD